MLTSERSLADHTRHQVALRLLPFLFILYIVNYIDRTNVAYAAIGMTRDLGFTDRVFGLGAGIFFVSYVSLQIPGALLVERWSARRMIAGILVAWGALTALTALVHTPSQLYVARLALGAAEAGFFPGVIVYLSHWFMREDRAKATSNFMAAIPMSFMIGSPIAGWILGHHWLGLQGWRWLFFLEGAPAVLLGMVAFFYLTDQPSQASWLSAEQKRWMVETLKPQTLLAKNEFTIRQALKSRIVNLLACATFLAYFSSYTFVFWFPTLLKRLSGYSDLNVGLLGAIPYIVLFFAMQVNGWHSDLRRERRWHAAIPLFIAAAGFFGLLAQIRSMPLTFLLFCMVASGSGFLVAAWAIPTEILSKSAAAAAVGMINAVGSIAGFAGPYLFGYLNTRTGSSSLGMALMGASSLSAGLLLLLAKSGLARLRQT